MGRPAKQGGGTYEWVLRRYGAGPEPTEPVLDLTSIITLPSVTTILGTVLAKPALVPWAVKVTREGAVKVYADALAVWENFVEPPEGTVHPFHSEATLAKALEEIGYTSDQVRDARAAEGTAVHEYLTALARADKPIKPSNPFEAGIMDWWLSAKPDPTAVDEVVYSLEHGYCGTLDLEADVTQPASLPDWRSSVLIDLKTRKAGAKCAAYQTEHLQTAAYWLARGADTRVGTAVLVVNGDGEYGWHKGNPERDAAAFLHVLATYNWLHAKEER